MLLDLLVSVPSMIENRTSIIRIRSRNELDSLKRVVVYRFVVVEFRTSLFRRERERSAFRLLSSSHQPIISPQISLRTKERRAKERKDGGD